LAEKDNPDAMCAVATCFNDGRAGVEINPKIATSWWMTACEKYDHIQSLYEMGVAFYTGEGVPENEEVAVEYFRRAADSGHPGACYVSFFVHLLLTFLFHKFNTLTFMHERC
jgi:TPR repeat protein